MKKILSTLISLFILFISSICIELYIYKKSLDNSLSNIKQCYYQDTKIRSIAEAISSGKNSCYEKMFNLVIPRLLINEVNYNNKQKLTYNKIDDIFIVPNELINEADTVLSWGLGPNYQFEKEIATDYNKTIYAFDCGFPDEEIEKIKKDEEYKNLIIQRECIGCDKYIIYGQVSNHKIHTFGQKLKELNLEDKKIYIKLGIPEVHEYIDDILKYKDNILGISIAIDFWSPRYIIKSFYVLDKLNKDFILVSRKAYKVPKYENKKWTSTISLTYINKDIVNDYHTSWDQNKNKSEKDFIIIGEKGEDSYIKKRINFIAVLYSKIKNFRNENKSKK